MDTIITGTSPQKPLLPFPNGDGEKRPISPMRRKKNEVLSAQPKLCLAVEFGARNSLNRRKYTCHIFLRSHFAIANRERLRLRRLLRQERTNERGRAKERTVCRRSNRVSGHRATVAEAYRPSVRRGEACKGAPTTQESHKLVLFRLDRYGVPSIGSSDSCVFAHAVSSDPNFPGTVV